MVPPQVSPGSKSGNLVGLTPTYGRCPAIIYAALRRTVTYPYSNASLTVVCSVLPLWVKP
jgi:hypothetical protein